MKKIGVVIVVIIILAVFNRCGQISSLSGKYVNEQDRSEYIKFSGESTVILHTGGEDYKGTYYIYENAVMLNFASNNTIENTVLEIKSKKVLSALSGLAYVKRTFWNYYVKKIMIFGLIVCAILFVIKIAKDIKKDWNARGMTMKEAWKFTGEELRPEYEKEMEEARKEAEEGKKEWENTKKELREDWKNIKDSFKKDKDIRQE